VLDAKHLLLHLDEIKPDCVENEAVEQLSLADRVILDKTDLVDAEHVALRAVEFCQRAVGEVAAGDDPVVVLVGEQLPGSSRFGADS
jgi:G3E family GTPase